MREVEFYGYTSGHCPGCVISSRDGTLSSPHLANFTNKILTAYSTVSKIYGLFLHSMSHEELLNSSILASLQLGSCFNFDALHLIMTPFTRRELLGRKNITTPGRTDGSTNWWQCSIHKNIKPEMKRYYEWPIWVQDELVREG
jgi:hypothetical protein